MKKLVFVCTINRHRSVIAEFLFRRFLVEQHPVTAQRVEVSSAGIVTKAQKLDVTKQGIAVPRPLFGYRPMPCVILYLQKQGIDASEHRSRALAARMANEAGLLIAMGESHKRSILSEYPAAEGKTFTLAELSHPFQIENIVVDEPPGLMPPSKFCMLQCDHWSITGTVIDEINERLEEAVLEISARLAL